jgi:hypothetical protein
MKPKKYTKPRKKEKAEAEEPACIYGDKSITFFNSFEEMNEFDAQEMSKYSPVEHLQNATSLIKIVFVSALKKKFDFTQLHFKK